MLQNLTFLAKRLFFPGLDLHTRCRYRFLAPFLTKGKARTLDAGFGNGALSYAAYRKGSSVTGVSFRQREVDATAAFFRYLGIPRAGVEFRLLNIYDLRNLECKFDQIICSETLEHIARDEHVVRMFADLLNPGGKLLLCCPHAVHPEHALGRENGPEDGSHVRDGYTIESYTKLLKPAGFRIVETVGLGSPLLCRMDRLLRTTRTFVGDFWSMPLFLATLPFTAFDSVNPEMPFSLAVLAEKIGS
jgi:SAM-dependent methyltransferase